MRNLINKLMKEKTDNILIQIFRYFIVSGLSLAVDFCTLFILTNFFGFHYLLSGVLSYSIGLVINYFISVAWVFKSRTYEDRRKEFIIFILIGVIGLGVNAFILWLCTDIAGLYYMVSRIISAGIGYAWKYVARRPQFSVRPDGDRRHRDFLPAGLDYRFQRVCVIVEYVQPHRGVPAVCPEAARRVGYVGVRGFLHDPASQPLEFFLQRGKVRRGRNRPFTYHDVGFVFDYRADQLRYVVTAVLVVRIRVDNDVGAEPQTGVDSRDKTFRKPFVPFEIDDVQDPAVFLRPIHGDFNGIVSASVIYNQIFYCINTFYRFMMSAVLL